MPRFVPGHVLTGAPSIGKPRFWELRKRTAEKHKELIDRYEDEERD